MRSWPFLVVTWCWRHPVLVVVTALLASIAMGVFAAGRLGLDTNQSHLISSETPYRKAERALSRTFPGDDSGLVAVIDAPTPELAEDAVTRLQTALAARTDVISRVQRPAEEVYFRAHGLLFLSEDQLTELSDRLVQAQPLLGQLARDVSLRGLLGTVDLMLQGLAHGQGDMAEMAPLFDRIGEAAAAVAAGQTPAPRSWSSLMGAMGEMDQARRYLMIRPVLDYSALESGRPAAKAVRAAAAAIGIDEAHGLRLRLTGESALADANFATVAEGVEITTPLMLGAVLVILFVAVRSARLVGAILVSLLVGLAATGAFAAAAVGTLNPISVAFAVMFVGIAVDFAIQFVARFRAELAIDGDQGAAMGRTAKVIAAPLSVAAMATAVGFLSFLPTDYTGVSQLGLIAGAGMVIALVIDFTLLPALMALLPPTARSDSVDLPLGAWDRWLERHARAVVVAGTLLALAGAALLPRLPLDFNPLHLQDPKSEAVSTFMDLARDGNGGAYAVDVLAEDLAEAKALAAKLKALPEAGRVMTVDSFVPDGQDDKLAILEDLSTLLGATLNPARTLAPPDGADLQKALQDTAAAIDALGGEGAPLAPLAGHLRAVAGAGPEAALKLQAALVSGLGTQLDMLRRMLAQDGVLTRESLPPDLARSWLAPDGKMKVKVYPKGDMGDEDTLLAFADAVGKTANTAGGLPISIKESGKVVVGAFTQAGLSAVAAIALLLWILFRRVLDSALVVLPLVVGALYTVIGCVAGSLAINFANIIALPLLLGIGVAFNIYFVVNWREGVTRHLSSPTTRAVLFSALTTGTAFGSLAASPHLGTASMGFLLFLSLGLSVATTFVLLPAVFHLLGKPK